MAYVITEGCADVLDRSCLDSCPVDCISEGDNQMFINPDDCIDCGACELTCPADAIYHIDELPDELKGSIDANALFFK